MVRLNQLTGIEAGHYKIVFAQKNIGMNVQNDFALGSPTTTRDGMMTVNEVRRKVQAKKGLIEIFCALEDLRWEIQIAMSHIEDGNELKALKKLEKISNWQAPDLPA